MSRTTHYRLVCPYCGEKTQSGHLVPASAGEPSFTVCKTINRMEQEAGMPKKVNWLSPSTPDPAREEQKMWRFSVDGTVHDAPRSTLLGCEIKAISGGDPRYMLYFDTQMTDKPDEMVYDTDAVDLAVRNRFYTVPPATFAATPATWGKDHD